MRIRNRLYFQNLREIFVRRCVRATQIKSPHAGAFGGQAEPFDFFLSGMVKKLGFPRLSEGVTFQGSYRGRHAHLIGSHFRALTAQERIHSQTLPFHFVLVRMDRRPAFLRLSEDITVWSPYRGCRALASAPISGLFLPGLTANPAYCLD